MTSPRPLRLCGALAWLLAWRVSCEKAALSEADPGDQAALVQRAVSLHNSTGERTGRINYWLTTSALFTPSASGFDSVAVKDPSIVFYSGNWHLFYTAGGPSDYSLGYASAPKIEDLGRAPRSQLSRLRGWISAYAAAPQVFYFEPQKTWYLIFQTKDALPKRSRDPYYPMFSTNPDISDINGWSEPQALIEKDSMNAWIDFWTICDKTHAYLFYTRDQNQVMVRSTPLERFPVGWSKATTAVDNLHEAAHVYKVKGRNEYHMIFEVRNKGMRSFGLATADKLTGPWHKRSEPYATVSQFFLMNGQTSWTDVVSHGEAIRTGYDQQLDYEPKNARWLIQGMLGQDDGKRPYDKLRWSLGLIHLNGLH